MKIHVNVKLIFNEYFEDIIGIRNDKSEEVQNIRVNFLTISFPISFLN